MIQPILKESLYEPRFRVHESLNQELGDKEVNQTFRAILSYKVIEKTKSFVILRITNISLFPTARIL